jgi:cytochrome P450
MSAEVGAISRVGGRISIGRRVNTGTRAALPPGPRMPSALQAVGWTWRSLPFMERCQKRYGDIFTLRVRHGGTWVLVCNPEDVKRVFTAAPERLGVGEANTLLGPVLGPRSVMLLEEPQHMTRRRLMLPQFHGRRMESYGGMMGEVARAAVAQWPTGRPFELWPRMQAITLEAVMRVVFGPAPTDSTRRLGELLRELTDRMNAPRRLTLLALLGPRSMVGDPEFRAAMDLVEAVALEEVRKRRAEGEDAEREDIVSMLAHAHYEDGSRMTAQDLRDELITLLLDGPTSTSLAWVFERLLRHPDKLRRLREEVLRGEEDDAYLDAVVRETLRLCPPVPIVVRKLLQPMELGGYTVPAGAMVAPCIHLVHRREDVYPHPRRFMPERFLKQPAGTYTWIPFGGGVRRCLAASFALLEMKRVVAAVLEEVELQPVDSRSEQVRKSAISYSPGRRGLVQITRRPGL